MNWPFLFFVVVAAFLFAKIEIEIEGRHGWAENLPTWRVEHHFLLDWFFGGRSLTAITPERSSSSCFCSICRSSGQEDGVSPFLIAELHVFWGYLLFWVLEDMLWFVLNPHYGWKKFTKENVPWHKRWALGVPADYWAAGALAILLLVVPTS